MRSLRPCACLLAILLAATSCRSPDSRAVPPSWSAGFDVGILPELHALKAAAAPTIEGNLDDACWQDAPRASSFITISSDERAQFATEAMVSYDERNLYVAFVCREPEIDRLKIARERAEHDDKVWEDDCVEVFISPEGGDVAFQFIANAAGSKGEYRNGAASWDGSWTAKTAVLPGAWQAEMAVPFETMGARHPRPGDAMRINFARGRKCKGPNEDSAWSPCFGDIHDATRFGRIVFADETPRVEAAAPPIRGIRLAKRLEVGENPVTVDLATASTRRLKVRLESRIGRADDIVEKEARIDGDGTLVLALNAPREGAFFASVSVFENDQLMERKFMSGNVTRPVNARGAHPRLFFAAQDLDALKRKMADPRFKRDWEAIRKSAETALEGPAIAEGKPWNVLAQAAGAASTCAFVYRLTGEERFGRRAREICDAVLAADNWTGNFLDQKGSVGFHLLTAATCERLALAYDMLAPDMSKAERERFARTCWDKALKTYIDECRDRDNPYLYGSRTMNWLAVLTSGAGCLFIALDGDGMDFTREIEIARAHILRYVEWHDDDGSAVEHGGYWTYGMGQALTLMRALDRNGWPGIMKQRSRKLERTAYPVLYGCIGGKNVTNFCDDSYGPLGGARGSALLLAAEFADGRVQWWADRLPPAGAFGFIVGDETLEAAPPDDLPTCMVFQRMGIGILRASMSDPDTRYLAIKGGRARGDIFDDPHCQFDLNAVVLDALGVTLLADPGYGHDWKGSMSVNDPAHPYNSTPPHNTVLVDGRGQEAQWSPIAHLEDLSPGDDIDCVVSRIEQGYGPKVKRFDRHAYFVDKRFFVIFDDIELNEPGVITWNFHGAKDATISTGEVSTIANGPAELRMVAQSAIDLTCARKDDHVLPRIEWNTTAKTKSARVAWLLVAERKDTGSPMPTLKLHEDHMTLTAGAKTWRLPIVRRRAPFKSSMTLIRDPE